MVEFTYWIFYIKKDAIHDRFMRDNICGKDGLPIYAYTDNKTMAKKFMEERNMDKFYMKKVKIINKEINKLNNDYPHQLLSSKYLITSDENRNDCKIAFSITDEEFRFVTHYGYQILSSGMSEIAKYSPKLFNKRYWNALDTLMYTNAFMVNQIHQVNVSNKQIRLLYSEKGKDKYGYDRPFYDAFMPDTLSIFIHYYGELIKV